MKAEGEDLRATLREELDGRLRRSPLDFIREMDPSGDRAMWLDELTRPVAPEHDLTLAVDVEGAGRTAVFAEVLPWDTEFFGFTVARLNAIVPLTDPAYQVLADFGVAVDQLLELCRSRGVRYLLAPVDARDMAVARALTSRGFELIESRLHYHGDLNIHAHQRRFAVRLAAPADVPVLADVAEQMVNPYDRFHADPVLFGDPANRMMRRWVEASVCDGFADATLVPDVDRPGAFVTVKYHRERWKQWGLRIGQPIVAAVSRDYRGWYFKLISEVCVHLLNVGAEHVYLVSQSTNSAVLRGWEKLGLRYGKNEVILRRLVVES